MVISVPSSDPSPRGGPLTGARDEAPTAGAGPWRVVLADRYAMVRAAIGALLSTVTGFEVVGEAATGAELVALVELAHPDLAITEVCMPGPDAFGAIAEIHRRYPHVRLLALSADETIDAVKHAISSGACGYLMKRAPSYELEHAVRSVMTRGFYYSPLVAQRLLDQPQPAADQPLTPRQVQILTLLAQGRSSREIAGDLGLSSKTVDVHRGRIMSRLELNDVASLARYALRNGLLPGGG
ncbi:response regulator transcription factor [Ramlibacter sp. RBP-2]|uniref:Response regulator transcription factor n=1 Tax=Ramlibacter lithotrophicus TaxID=2606681 RepID=A0A7X6DIA1_9BURK|nr:response regulator transcription factor [Ramlibacter lithotrophicus]